MTNHSKSMVRRDLLKVAPVAGVAVFASEGEAKEPSHVSEDPREVRLADSDHVRTYYKLSRE